MEWDIDGWNEDRVGLQQIAEPGFGPLQHLLEV